MSPDPLLAPLSGADHCEVAGMRYDAFQAGAGRIKRLIYPPGFRWSTHMKPVVKTEYCMHAHVGFLARGHIKFLFSDGCSLDFVAPCFVVIEPGHDGWVEGEETAVLIQFDFEKDTVQRLGMPDAHRHD